MAKKNYYAFKAGKIPGTYESWDECSEQTTGFPGAKFKGFATLEEAELFMKGGEAPTYKSEVSQIGADTKIKNTSGYLHCYVDGSYKDGRYGWGFAVYSGGELIHKDCGSGDDKEAASIRNVAGELAAAMRATLWAHKNKKKIIINYDYIGIEAWVINEWKCKNPMTIAYKEFMNKYKSVYKFRKVKAHSSDMGNDLADKLARQGLSK